MTSDAKEPTIGTRLMFFAMILRSVKKSERPTVAPIAQAIPPIKLLLTISQSLIEVFS